MVVIDYEETLVSMVVMVVVTVMVNGLELEGWLENDLLAWGF